MKPRIVMTAGGTREPIDDIRYVSNVASGRLPAQVANDLLSRGCEVWYIHGPGAVLPANVRVELDMDQPAEGLAEDLEKLANTAQKLHRAVAAGTLHTLPIETAEQARAQLETTVASVQPDVTICAMAVADYAPIKTPGKVSSQLGQINVTMRPTPKTIDSVKRLCRETVLFGFKLLSGATEEQRQAACRVLIHRAGADFVVCNDMVDYREGIRRGWLFDHSGVVIRELGDADATLKGFAGAIATAVMESVRPPNRGSAE